MVMFSVICKHLLTSLISIHWGAGTTPTLELYTTLERTAEENELILEESVDGMEFVAGAIFSDADDGKSTSISFRMGYFLPGRVLSLFETIALFITKRLLWLALSLWILIMGKHKNQLQNGL